MSYLRYAFSKDSRHCECESVMILSDIPTEIEKLLRAAEQNNAAAVLYDENDNIIYCNEKHKTIYSFVDYSISQNYTEFAYKGVECGLLDDREVYDDPDAWVNRSIDFRRRYRWAQYLINHSSGNTYLAHHQRFEGFGCVALRFNITDKLYNKNKDSVFSLGRFDPVGGKWLATALMQHFEEPTGIVSRSGRLIDGNDRFMKVLDRNDGIFLSNGRVVLSNQLENAIFNKLILSQSDWQAHGSQMLKVSRSNEDGYLFLSVSSMSLEHSLENRSFHGAAMISIVDPDSGLPIKLETVKGLFGLTLAEARIAISISSGKDLNEIALDNAVSVGTVRNQLKSVFLKTGVNKQSELIRLMYKISSIYRGNI